LKVESDVQLATFVADRAVLRHGLGEVVQRVEQLVMSGIFLVALTAIKML
jgi:hypothetical protein